MAKRKYYVRKDGLHETSRTINGKRVVFRGKTDREVDQRILNYHEREEKGRTFAEVADEWIAGHEKRVSDSTGRVYAICVNHQEEAFQSYIKDIRPLDVQRYVRKLEAQGKAGNTVSTELSVLKMIFAYAVISGDIDTNPAAEVKKSRGLPKKERTALTEEQESIVKAQAMRRESDFWLFPYFLLYTGMRRGEALALSYSDIDRKAGVIHVNKKLSYALSHKPKMEMHLKSENGLRDVPLLAPLERVLPRDRAGLIFPGRDGGFMTATWLKHEWESYCRTVGFWEIVKYDNGKTEEVFPITPHCFRHSFASICYEAGLDPRQAAQFLGDTPEVVAKVYTHLREEKRQTAEEKLKAFCEAAAVTV